ncbi:hypothetical protein [[Mycobacterium] holstebronense]|uniref:PPE family protein n=1 Tax=[Mycobacterium] holstebronense TaxID=3064288 RepID=A0ABM9M5S6_9MYCO|nr:hypothetical protein [Mycolicibacter sp. MU0102]CAJ1510497.1 hypothetical protein MU0102_004205 [Mycolicibacter sp. MU0102]
MWTASNGYSRAIASVTTAGVVALTAGAVTPIPAAASPVTLPSAAVFTPVELTALSADSSLMDIVGALTGLSWIIPFLDDPGNPLFPFVISLEALGELFVVIPLTLVFGAPLLLITEGWQGVVDTVTLLGTAFDAVSNLAGNLLDWYETRNWFTGELLDPGSSEAIGLTGLGDIFHAGSWDDVFTPVGLDGVLPADGFDTALPADGFDVVLPDLGLGDLIA